ncbi:tyrosine--tRNA ligase [Aromatoleum petrolei]|uniref:Tyrosine--tRNA ligase n=1 Tax=Aromatoleum petrolei TaxID=76116 RepID=A0ABX1MG77_9RHOO|nr:tyrosine--tRNA ligase [Aromatoleum petrolei]NMF86947.1 tyrosine--tRNA ligase [Aromatoleum petrolei]QTQ37542.1 Tyrosine--tRNA ligase [Aromatoleum petrolei]
MPHQFSDIFHILEERGFIHQCTDAEGLRRMLATGSRRAYLGFDATADSLHVGHLQGLMLMRWLQRAGHRPIMLVGGATTRIGDPSFRDTSRPLLDEATIAANIDGITGTFARYLRMDDGPSGALVVNNADWLDGLGYLDFLSRVGRHFTINRLLSFDAIRTRLEYSLSFQEFGYTLLQAFDFTELAQRCGCTVQVGGADQWANIVNGVELSRRQGGPELFGLTMPLLVTADGRKMGKSAQGAVWLNSDRLAPFDFWQFWRNVDDRDVGRFLALFTELPMVEVRRLGALEGAELNEAKILLATEATGLAHGEEVARAAAKTAACLFCDGESDEGLATLVVAPERVSAGLTLAELAVEGGLAPSRNFARRLATGGGLRLNGKQVEHAEVLLPVHGREWRLSVGRKQHLRIVVSG